jgi:hypothetical protein
MTVNVSKPAINLREKLAELDKPSGIAGEAMLRAETPQEQFQLIGAGRRNLIINGNFQVSQRGNYSSATAISNVTYYLDRWEALVAGNTATLTHTGNRARVTASASSSAGRYGMRQQIEHESWMAGKWMTVSAKVKSNTSNAFVYIFTDDGIVARTEKHSGNEQDEVLNATFYTASDNTTIQLYARVSDDDGFTVNVLSGDYIEITEVQLELGKVATPFEHRSYGEELALCQRYYQKHDLSPNSGKTLGQFHTSNQFVGPFEYPVTMRAIPTFTGISYGSGSNYVYSGGAYKGVPNTFNQDTINQSMVLLRVSGGSLSGTVGVAGVMYGLVFSLDAEL